MRWAYRIVRTIFVTVILLGLVIPALLYVLLTLPPVQNALRDRAQHELSTLLGVDVTIGKLGISPFNRATLGNVALVGELNDTIATIEKISAGVSLSQLLIHDNIVITYTELVGLDGHISRATPDSPLNIQPIIDALSPKDKNKPPTLFDLKINTVIIRQSALTYDLLSAPPAQSGRFDANHLAISNLRADIALPRIKNDDFTIDVKQLAFIERSGLHLRSLSGIYHITNTGITARKPYIRLNDSRLTLGDISLTYNSFQSIGRDLRDGSYDLSVLPGTSIVPRDLSPILPFLYDVEVPLDIVAHVAGRLEDLDIDLLEVTTPDNSVGVDIKGRVGGLPDMQSLDVALPRIDIHGSGPSIARLLDRFTRLSDRASHILTAAGNISVKGNGNWNMRTARFDGDIATDLGLLSMNADCLTHAPGRMDVSGHFTTSNFNLGRLLSFDDMGLLSLDADVKASLAANQLKAGRFAGKIDRLDFRSHSYSGIAADIDYDGAVCRGNASINDPELTFALEGELTLDSDMPLMDLKLDIDNANLALLGFATKYPDYRLSVDAAASLRGKSINTSVGDLWFGSLYFVNPEGKGLSLTDIAISADNLSSPQRFNIVSEFIEGRVEGTYTVTDLPHCVERIIAEIFPSLLPGCDTVDGSDTADNPVNDLHFDFNLKPTKKLDDFIRLPFSIEEDIKVTGMINSADRSLRLNVLSPYIIKGGLMLCNTALEAAVTDGSKANIYLTTTALNQKNDNITFVINADGYSDRLDSDIMWDFNRIKRYDGNLRLTTSFSRQTDSNALLTRIDVNPSEFVVNDTIWEIERSAIEILPNFISIDRLKVQRENQFVDIAGKVSKNPADILNVDLSNINLDYIFESLAIDNVMFGGVATGKFTASEVLSGAPHLSTDRLDVRNLSYNNSLLGNAIIKSSWDNTEKAVTINATINQPNGCTSYVDGDIKPLADSLDIRFDADRINVGFMLPFMQAFASEVGGYASGHARLWGSFKNIDMVGDIYAEDLKLKLAFTNTAYFATDSVRLEPGFISLKDIKLHDIYGNEAILNGWLKHKYFRQPEFDFQVTEAKNLLVYDVAGNPQKDRWYGRVFGNGFAGIKGRPGRVDIDVNMTTAPKSTFTFVLSDSETAYDYDFITFRNKAGDADEPVNTQPAAVVNFIKGINRIVKDKPSVYAMNIDVTVTPQAEVILVMDPIGGDRIRAYGAGNLRMNYESDTNDIRMYGEYTLERGSYNFTLQDIIIKDFNILNGSSIIFKGDPYDAQLNIEAEYVVQANLGDLDESFLEDKDINRTVVPVHAMLYITGGVAHPEIKFGLNFPMVDSASDIDRKVKSIISTDDMMSRQIVYLLALNRFYTPEYMSGTKGNELVSVASSTLSSQLGNVLGQISENWNIAPAVRSDKGDFTDMEFDLALSSTLLNNRLLLNGNFGYRDNALNNNSFIGDFDIEYLLNRTGTIRLKAYNRYNDQNYFVKSALTTQGVGVMFRRDFDNIFSFLKPFKKKKSIEAPDSVTPTPQPADSLDLHK